MGQRIIQRLGNYKVKVKKDNYSTFTSTSTLTLAALATLRERGNSYTIQLKRSVFDDNSPAIHRRVGNRRTQRVPSGRLIINSKHTRAIIAGDMFSRPYETRVSAIHYTGNKLPAYYQISLTGFAEPL